MNILKLEKRKLKMNLIQTDKSYLNQTTDKLIIENQQDDDKINDEITKRTIRIDEITKQIQNNTYKIDLEETSRKMTESLLGN